jgi:hypothetical protein
LFNVQTFLPIHQSYHQIDCNFIIELQCNGNEIVICSNASVLTVTLNPEADHKERAIIVRNGPGSVKVTAVKKISGKTTKVILRRYTSIDHIFTTEADSWNVI